MIRRAHWLSGNKSNEMPSCAAWVDTETKQQTIDPSTVSMHLTQGMACFSRTRKADEWLEPSWCRFTKPQAFWKWLTGSMRAKVRCYLFAHNWSFDAPVLQMFSYLPKHGWKLQKAVIESPPVILTWRKGNQTITCLDTLNWWRVPLRMIGASIGLEKLEMPAPGDSRDLWDGYNRRDVEIIYRVMREWWKFLRAHDLGSFAPTLASQSMRAFRHRFMKHKILIDSDPRALELARASLHGGRVECFQIGRIKGPISVYDVNSMYPHVMRKNLFPSALIRYHSQVSLADLRRWSKNRCVIARVRLSTRRPRFAHVYNGRLIFPTGRIIETLTTPDLLDALAHREIISVESAAVYVAEPIFSTFVEEIYSLRRQAEKKGNRVEHWLLKILMNSLYGKFAQRANVWEMEKPTDDLSVRQWMEYDYETGSLRAYRQFAGIVQRKHRDSEALDSHPAIASHVTAYARKYLFDLAQAMGKDRVLYVDTDSLFVRSVSRRAQNNLSIGSGLGELKLEAIHDWVVLNGPKDYETPDKIKIKGIRNPSSPISPGVFSQEQWSSLAGLIGRGSLNAPTIRTVTKKLSRIYTKGQVTKDGRVLPFVLREW